MRRVWLHALVLLTLSVAGAAAAQPPPDPVPPPAPDAAPPRGPYVGDETHRAPLDSDIPFAEGVVPRDRPLVFARPSARSGRGHAARGRHAAAGRRHAAKGRHGGGKHAAHRRRH